MSHTVKWISFYALGWGENEKATETERNVQLPKGQAFPVQQRLQDKAQ